MKLNAEVANLLLRMRRIMRDEFGDAPPLQDADAVEKYYDYGTQSQHLDLRKLAEQLAASTSRLDPNVTLQSPDTTPSSKPSMLPPQTDHATANPPRRDPSPATQPAAAKTRLATEQRVAPAAPPGILELLVSDRFARPTRLLCPGVPPFVVDAPQQRCFLAAEFNDLLPLRQADMRTIRLENVSPQALERCEKEAKRVDLKAFWWFCGHSLSPRLMQPIASWSAFRLDRRPDFAKLAPSRHQLQLATALMKESCSFESLVERANVSQKEAIAFLNAAFLCRWLVEANGAQTDASTAPEGASSRRPGLMDRIRARLT